MAAVVSFYSLGGDPDLSFSVYTEDEVPTPEPGGFWRVLVTVCASVKDVAERAIFSFQLMLSPAESLPWIDALKFAESCNRMSKKESLGAGGRRELARTVAGCVRAELAATSKKARACTRCHHSLFHLRCPTCSSEDGLTSIPPLGNPVPLPMSSAPSIHPTTATIDALNSAARCAAALVARKQTPRTLQKAVEAAVAVMDNSRFGGGGLAAARSDDEDDDSSCSLSSTAGITDTSPEVSATAGTSRQQRLQQSPNRARRPRHTAILEPIHSPPSPSRCSSCSDLSTDIDLNGCLTASEETISDGPTVPSPHPDTRFVPPVVPTLVLPSPTRSRDPECDTPIQAPLTPAQAPHTQPQPNPHPTFPVFDRTSSSSSCRSTSSVTPDAPPPFSHPHHKKALEVVHEIEPTSPNCIPALLQPSTLLHPQTSTDSSSFTHSLSSGSMVATVTISPFDQSRSVTVTPFNPPHFDRQSTALDALDFQLRGSRGDAPVRIDVERYDPPARTHARTPSPAPLSPSAPSPSPPTSIPSHALEFDEAFTAVSSFFGQVFNTATSHEASSSASQSMASAESSRAPSRAPSLPTTSSVSPTLTPALSGRSSMEAPQQQQQQEADPPTPTLAPGPATHSRPSGKRTAAPSGKQGRADGGSRLHDQDAVRDGKRHGHYGGEALLGPTTPRYMTPRYEIITTAVPTLRDDSPSSELPPPSTLPARLLSGAVPSLDSIPSPSNAASDPSAAQSSSHQRPPTAPKAIPPNPSAATAIPNRGQSSRRPPQPPPPPQPSSALLVMPQEAGVWGREGGPMRECLGSSPVNNIHVPKMLRHASQPVMAEIQEEPITAAEADRSPLRTVARQRTSPSYHSFGIQLGQGSFGTVQKGLWRGRMVAIKTICVQGTDVRGQEHAMREAAITYALDHPNIIKTYSWDIQVAPDAAAPGALTGPKTPRTPAAPKTPRTPRVAPPGTNAPPDWVVSMVVELCDADLVQALRASCFHTPDRRALLPSILQIALDIARGMEHLHTRRIIHGDLKSTNVLLKHHRGAASGFVAKVADLGMSYKLPRGATEIVGVHSGTRGYIAPEVQHEGTISQSSDVYSFGVVLWELYHAKPAVASRSFPSFQRGCPPLLEELTRSCLYPNPEERPTFGGVMLQLCPLIDAVTRPARQRDPRRSASQVTL